MQHMTVILWTHSRIEMCPFSLLFYRSIKNHIFTISCIRCLYLSLSWAGRHTFLKIGSIEFHYTRCLFIKLTSFVTTNLSRYLTQKRNLECLFASTKSVFFYDSKSYSKKVESWRTNNNTHHTSNKKYIIFDCNDDNIKTHKYMLKVNV